MKIKKSLSEFRLHLFILLFTFYARVIHADVSPKAPKIDTVTLNNPLKNIDSIQALLVAILNIVEILMVPVMVFFIIMAGFKYVTAQGNSSKVGEATRALTYAVIGGVLILAAVAISGIIQSTVSKF